MTGGLREADAQALLLVRAFEQADAEGRLLPSHERTRASEQARGDEGTARLGCFNGKEEEGENERRDVYSSSRHLEKRTPLHQRLPMRTFE